MKKISLWALTVFWASAIFYLTTIPNFKSSSDSFLSFILSNGGHFFFFGIQAVLIYLCLIPLRFAWVSALTTTSIYGLAIEYIQINIPGRSYDLKDWALDTLGAILFLVILLRYHPKRV